MRWFFISSQFYSQFSVRAMIVVAKAGNCPPESSRSFQRTFYKAANWPVLRVCLETQLIIRVLFWWSGMDCWKDCQWSLILTLIDNSLILLSQPLIMLWHVTLGKKVENESYFFFPVLFPTSLHGNIYGAVKCKWIFLLSIP